MARIIAPDVLQGDVRLSVQGDEVRRVFLVGELRGAAFSKLIDAAEAPGVPRKAQPHPTRAGLSVIDVTARPHDDDPELALVEVYYANPASSAGGGDSGGVRVSVGSDLLTEITIHDVNGRLMSTQYRFVTQISSFTGGTSQSSLNNVHRVEVQRPTFSLRFTRRESANARDLARRYSGTTNLGQFQGEPTDRYLCNVESTQVSDGQHDVTYSFLHNPKGWQSIVYTRRDGAVPVDVTPGNGVAVYQVYRRESFGAFGLPG